ncbi:MAG: hypothetical protein IT204_06655 [Fimbriimonadaceae bacterium]|nr:hypothetical protein [Fimbriimonadaceae bacterium]
MGRRLGWRDLGLLALAWVPALYAAAVFPAGLARDLPTLAVALYAAWRLGVALTVPPRAAFAASGLLVGGLWAAALKCCPAAMTPLLALAAALLLASLLAVGNRRHRTGQQAAAAGLRTAVVGGCLVLALAVLWCQPAGRPAGHLAASPEPAATRPAMFIPLEVDPRGERLALFSLRDLDPPDPDTFALWSLNLQTGQPTCSYRGFPFLMTSWCPAGQSLALMASRTTWAEDEAVPFGLVTAAAAGGASKELLPPPVDGTSWLYPAWSPKGNQIAAWKMAAPQLGSLAPTDDLPRSYAVSASGGQPRELKIPGCRLALFGGWMADQPGAFMITEKGLFALPPEGKPRRLVPAGEAPLDPFPFVIDRGVSPSGKHLAYLELTFGKGDLERVDLGLTDLRGKRRVVLRDLYPVAFDWSRNGRWLAAAQVVRGDALVLHLWDTESGQHRVVKTPLKLAQREYPVRLQFSPDQRWLALDGQFRNAESWDIALCDLQSGQTKLVESVREHLAAGWRRDNMLVISTLSSVALLGTDGRVQPIYGDRAAATDWRELVGCGVLEQQRERDRQIALVRDLVTGLRAAR